jgi:hypothetical protein
VRFAPHIKGQVTGYLTLLLMETFAYTPLEDNQIRLLVLSPGSGNDDLVCALTVEDLAKLPAYSALSYVWGSEDRPHRIRCSHAGTPKNAPGKGPRIFFNVLPQYLKITTNLKDALMNIRKPSEYQLLWADSICINQEDLQERARQVSFMNKIFGGARRVLIYVGNEDDKTASTFHFICFLYQMGLLPNDVKSWYPGVYEKFRDSKYERLQKFAENDPWVGWTQFLSRPW